LRNPNNGWNRLARAKEEVQPVSLAIVCYTISLGEVRTLSLPRDLPVPMIVGWTMLIYPLHHEDLGPLIASSSLKLEACQRPGG
jgi:hypothetical protein